MQWCLCWSLTLYIQGGPKTAHFYFFIIFGWVENILNIACKLTNTIKLFAYIIHEQISS